MGYRQSDYSFGPTRKELVVTLYVWFVLARVYTLGSGLRELVLLLECGESKVPGELIKDLVQPQARRKGSFREVHPVFGGVREDRHTALGRLEVRPKTHTR